MNEVTLHVTDSAAFFADVRATARQIDAGTQLGYPEARIGFEGAETLLKVLTPNRWQLLRRLRIDGPGSIRALAASLGRDYRGVHADVAALLDLGLIVRDEAGKISVPWSRITAELKLEDAA